MYYLDDLLSKVVTIKTQKGEEFIGRLIGIDKKKSVITVSNPKIVVIAGQDVALIPFALTAKTEMVFMQTDQLLTVLETMESSAEDYTKMIDIETELAQTAKFAEDEIAKANKETEEVV